MPLQQQSDDGGTSRSGPNPLVCENFQGINTSTTRAGVPDQQMFWCDGFMPIAPRNLRTLYGSGQAIFTAPVGVTVIYFDFYNIGSTPYMVIFQSNGRVVQCRTTDGALTTIIAPLAGISNPAITSLGVAQYGQQYLVIVANQPNGYWLWDGALLYTAGTLAPQITLTNPGTAYVTPPAVVFNGGHGSGASASAQVANGSVTNVTLITPGTGYQAGDTVTITMSGGQQTGTGATLTAVLSPLTAGSGATVSVTFTASAVFPTITVYEVIAVTVTNGGSGYSSLTVGSWVNPAPRQTSDNQWTGPSGQPAISFTISGGVITAATVANIGTSNSTWDTLTSSPQFPTITITDQAGSQFTVTSVTGTPSGANYSPTAVITVSGGGSPVIQATITPVISGGVVTGVNILNGGIYGSNTPPNLTVVDTAIAATATAQLMPFGVQGNAVQTYAGRIWVFNGAVFQCTAPGSVSDFATSDGGVSAKSNDSFLKVGYTAAVQTNGFLFLIGDSSMNYISGVQVSTSGNVTTTTYTNNNSDPEIGTPYPASVTTIGQDILIANQNGVYVSSGGIFEKKSEPLDGVYNSAPGVFNGQQLSAAKMLIFGKLVWMVLVPITDPITNIVENRLMMFNEKFWWTSPQDVSLTLVRTQEINSVFQAWGTDGTHILPLFTTPSVRFTKTLQTRLWDAPVGYDHTKSSVNLFAIAQFLGTSNLSYSVVINNENNQSAGPYTHSGTQAGQEVVSVMPPTAVGQIGVLTGMTVTTTASDLVIVSLMLQDEIVQYRA